MIDAREKLDLLSDILQVVNFYLLMRDASNNKLMEELQHQDSEYLDKIKKDIEQIRDDVKIIKGMLAKGGNTNDGKS